MNEKWFRLYLLALKAGLKNQSKTNYSEEEIVNQADKFATIAFYKIFAPSEPKGGTA